MISGLLLLRWTWPSTFWFLAILSAAVLLTMFILLPETGRSIVGNGGQPPSRDSKSRQLLNKPLVSILDAEKQQTEPQGGEKPASRKSFNPFSALLMLRDPGTLVVSVCFGIYYMVHTCLQASLSTVFVDIYQVSGLEAGLIYIPFGVGCSIASFIAGRN